MTSDHAFLGTHESDLIGRWARSGTGVIADAVAERIEWLTREVLEPLANDASGCETLFRDPDDGRLWERTFPLGEMHGGGPARLRVISEDDAAAKYERPWGRAPFERRRVGELAARYLSGQLAGRDFLLSAPDEPITEEVRELIDLIEHEPKKGGFFGVTAQEHDRHMARIRGLVMLCSLPNRPSESGIDGAPVMRRVSGRSFVSTTPPIDSNWRLSGPPFPSRRFQPAEINPNLRVGTAGSPSSLQARAAFDSTAGGSRAEVFSAANDELRVELFGDDGAVVGFEFPAGDGPARAVTLYGGGSSG